MSKLTKYDASPKKESEITYCEDCEHYKETGFHRYIDGEFVNGETPSTYYFNRFCMHPVCFEKRIDDSKGYMEKPIELKKRTRGYYQLNGNGHCIHFEKKSFWFIKLMRKIFKRAKRRNL